MDQIEWTDTFSVGVPTIDEQHQRLVALINRLFLAIMDNAGEAILGEVLAELGRYAHHHFAYEERLLAENGYPAAQFNVHRAEHERLTAAVADFNRRMQTDSATLDLALYDFLRGWMTDHLCGSDSQYATFLAARGVR